MLVAQLNFKYRKFRLGPYLLSAEGFDNMHRYLQIHNEYDPLIRTPTRIIIQEMRKEFGREILIVILFVVGVVVVVSAVDYGTHYFEITSSSYWLFAFRAIALGLGLLTLQEVGSLCASLWFYSIFVLKRWYCEKNLPKLVCESANYADFLRRIDAWAYDD
jgi:hypothetical protein